jgi:hypothetical protein
MIKDMLISLFTTFVVGPIQAELNAKLLAAQAPPEVISQVVACATAAPEALSARAIDDPAWALSSVVGVWLEQTAPDALLSQAVPGCDAAMAAAKPYLTQIGV